jgi:protein-L-isoaspartate(D-aspartate) O-methyltransferase
MASVDRRYYSPSFPYEDSPQTIGYGATISAPHMHAYALELLHSRLVSAHTALDVGSGTGYLTAAMALSMPPGAKVYGIEHVPELVKKSIENIKKGNPEVMDKIKIEVGDGRMGWTKDKDIKFDVIHVGAAA